MNSDIRVALPLIFAVVFSIAAPATQAQSVNSRSSADPAEASASVPSLTYRSPFSAYRGYSEQEIAPWRESNDTTGSIGGWRVYAREAQQTPAAEKPQAKPAALQVAKPPAKPMPMGPQHKPMGQPMHGAVPDAPKNPHDAHQHH